MLINFDLAEQYVRFPKIKVEDVQKILAWIHGQPHMPRLSEGEVLLFYFACKCSTEITKQVIDKNFTCRTHIKELFSNLNVKSPEMQHLINLAALVPLPKLTPEGYRVFLFRLLDTDPSNFDLAGLVKVGLLLLDVLIRNEGLQTGYAVIVDHTGLTLGHLSRINVMVLKKTFYYIQEALPVQMKAFHFINLIPFFNKLSALYTPFMKKELLDTLHIHKKLEDCFEYIPLDVLPKDYGGSEIEIKQLHKRSWDLILSKHKEIIEYEKFYRINEKLRPDKPKYISHLYGLDGNFKKLEID